MRTIRGVLKVERQHVKDPKSDTHLNTGKIKTNKQIIMTTFPGGYQVNQVRESVLGGEFVESII